MEPPRGALAEAFLGRGEAVVHSHARLLARALPTTIQSLLIARPALDNLAADALLTELLAALSSLPHLRTCDLRGLLTERSLSSVRLLLRKRHGRRDDAVAVPLPALEELAVSLHTFTAIGSREGRKYLTDQLQRAPRLSKLSCGFRNAGAIDVSCQLCGARLYDRLESYVVHPPQQPHITYEIHTDVPPTAAAVAAVEGDATRLQCSRRCHGRLWLVDGGSGLVRHVLGRRYAVACGPAKASGIAGRGYPALALATASGEGHGGTDCFYEPAVARSRSRSSLWEAW